MQIPSFSNQGKFDQRLYEQALQSVNMTPAVFEASQRDFLLRQKLERLVEDGVAVTDAELPAAYEARNPKAKKGDFEKNKVTFKQTYLAEKRREALEALLKGLSSKATIKINDQNARGSTDGNPKKPLKTFSGFFLYSRQAACRGAPTRPAARTGGSGSGMPFSQSVIRRLSFSEWAAV